MSAANALDVELFADRSGDPRLVIAHYARSGLRVFPVRLTPGSKATDKRPPYGYLWLERATSNVAHAVQDVDDACARYGDDNVAIAWALGLDGYLALDRSPTAGSSRVLRYAGVPGRREPGTGRPTTRGAGRRTSAAG